MLWFGGLVRRAREAISGGFQKVANWLAPQTEKIIDEGVTRDDFIDAFSESFSDVDEDQLGVQYDSARGTLVNRQVLWDLPDDQLLKDTDLLPSNRPLKRRYKILGEVIYIQPETDEPVVQMMGFEVDKLGSKQELTRAFLEAVIQQYPHLKERIIGADWYDTFIDPKAHDELPK